MQRATTLWIAYKLLSLSYWKQFEYLFRKLTSRLWIAYKLLSLSYWKQFRWRQQPTELCCELLINYYLCHTGNSKRPIDIWALLLWIAYKLLSLSYWKQWAQARCRGQQRCELLINYYLCHTGNSSNIFLENSRVGCELLINYYLCHTGNSFGEGSSQRSYVVNCL